MPRLCCVPLCKSNYKSTLKQEDLQTTFSFPNENQLRKKWLRAINRENFVVTKNSVVCCKHFDESEIQRFESFKDKEGVLRQCPLKRPKLNEGAVPHIFKNQPKYLTTSLPATRTNPDERRHNILKRESDATEAFLKSDIFANFEELVNGFNVKVSLKNWSYKVISDYVYLFLLNINSPNIEDVGESVKVVSTIVINKSCIVTVYVKNTELTSNDLQWVLPATCKLTRWSQLENLLVRYSFCSDICINAEYYINKAHTNLELAIRNIDSNESDIRTTLELLVDQLSLIGKVKKNYNMSTMLFSLVIFCQSSTSSSYERLRDFFILPTKRHLQQISADLNVTQDNDVNKNSNYLLHQASMLKEREKVVCLLVDEIYIKKGFNYKSKNITGFAENDTSKFAKTIQTLMISSAFGNFKEVVRLVPVNKMTGSELHKVVTETIKMIENHNFKVLCVITDNNRVNQKMFSLLANDTFYINNPSKLNEKIFLTYDFVHIFKNIYYNWMNLKNFHHTFIFPSFDNFEIKCKASFEDLRQFYQQELTHATKRAFKLNDKTLYPNNLERQSVSLAENIFHESTIAALNASETYKSTSHFLRIIRDWWNVVNVKNTFKGKVKRQSFCSPIYSKDDEKLIFLNKFLLWLDAWKQDTDNVCLTKDTFNALKRSTIVLIEIAKYAFTNFEINYILPGKFQTDNLEKRFGRYRNLSGCNYNVSYCQISESEKKIRLQNLFKLCNEKHNLNYLKSVFLESSEKLSEDITDLLFILETDYLNEYCLDESVKAYICGYAAHSIQKKIKCVNCKNLAVESKGTLFGDVYCDYLQKGGLCAGTDEIGYIYFHLCAIFTYITKNIEIEKQFLSKNNHQKVLTTLAISSIKSDNLYVDFSVICECGTPSEKIYVLAALIMSNIVLNNYSKNKNNDCQREKRSTKRKLTTLNN
jgi:hypothetical protein